MRHIFLILIKKNFLQYEELCLFINRDLQGLWIDGFRRSSNNESMQQNCQSLDPQFNIIMTYPAEDDILCLYYNYTNKKFYADNCNAERAFLCESLTTGELKRLYQVYGFV